MTCIQTIHCACGAGLATSIFMQINIEKVLQQLDKTDIAVTHSAATSVQQNDADIFVIGKDLVDRFKGFPRVVVINQILSYEETYEKVSKALSSDKRHFWIED